MGLPVFPGISGGTSRTWPCQYPLQTSTDMATIVSGFSNGSEQRFQDRSARASFIVQYTAIPYSDRIALDAFLLEMLGSVGKFIFTLWGGSAFSACQFDDETFSWQENKEYPLHYNGSMRFRVTTEEVFADAIPGVSNNPGPFPTVAGGFITGYPFTKSMNFQTVRVDMPTANRIAFPLYGSGFPGYPTRPLFSWTLTFPALTDADLATLFTHYAQASGRYALFSFVDPTDQSYYPSVRYDMDAFKVTYLKAGLSQIEIKLTEVYGAAWKGPTLVPVYSTGVVSPGILAALGTVDGHYTQTGPSYQPAAYVLTDFPWNYMPNNALSQWIGPHYGPNGFAAGTYTYTTTFDIGALDPNNMLLSGEWAADKFGSMYLNGGLVSQTGGFPVSKLESFSVISGFVPGLNRLTFIVSSPAGGSTGLRVALRCVAGIFPRAQYGYGVSPYGAYAYGE